MLRTPKWLRRGPSRASALRWVFRIWIGCWSTRGAKPRRANRSWSSAWTTWSIPSRARRPSAAFSNSIPTASCWPPAAATRTTANSTAASKTRLRVLDVAVSAGAQAVDVEIESAEAAAGKLSLFRGRARLIVSYHNYEATPQLDALLNRMTRIPADGYKIVTTARKPSDYGRVLTLAKAHPRTPLVVLAMGELGFPSRVLSAAFGGMYTYAAPTATQGTAAGQVCARQLRHLYRVEKLSRSSQDLRRDRRSGAPFDFSGRAQPRVSVPAHGRGLSAVPGGARADARFLYAGRAPAGGRLQRDHSAQAEDPALPGYRGSAGAAHRRGEHGLAQGRQMARHQYRRGGRDRAAGARRCACPTPRC